jgi:hypothetical protein
MDNAWRVNRPVQTWPWKFPLQTNIVRHDEKTNRSIAIDNVTLNIYNTIQYNTIYFIPIKVPQGAITNIYIHNYINSYNRPRFLCRLTALIILLSPFNDRGWYIRKPSNLPHSHRIGTFPRFVAIGFYFLSETLI